jgi:hypothetical protein
MMIPPFGPIRVSPSFFLFSERFGGWPNLFSEIRGIYRMWRQERNLDLEIRKRFRWAIRLVNKQSNEVLKPHTEGVKNLLFPSREKAEICLSGMFPRPDLPSWLEWKVVEK